MTKHTFQRMLIGSNEKSIITKNAGFGIRTISKGLSTELAQKLFQNVKTIYELPVSRQVTARQLKEDPKVVCAYPRTYRLCSFTDEGKNYYVASCATYVGIDYGYFCDKENARRAGSNYLTDVLISDQPIPASLWAQAAKGDLFAPKDNTADPNNPEMKQWLTGDPTPLEAKALELPGTEEQAKELTEGQKKTFVALLKALLENKFNKDCQKEDSLTRLMVLAPESKTADLLTAVALLPEYIANTLNFETNYLNGHGMPEYCNMVVINEHNTEETYAEAYVVLDLNGSEPKLERVADNPIYKEIESLLQKGDFGNGLALASYLHGLTLTEAPDYNTLMNAFKMTDTNLPIDIKTIGTDFLGKVKNVKLAPEKEDKLKSVVNNVLNKEIETKEGGQLDSTLAWVKDIWANFPAYFTITEANKNKLTDLWLGGKLVSHVEKYGEGFVKNCLKKNFDKELMLKSLKMSDSTTLWKNFLKLTYGEKIAEKDRFGTLSATIFGSKLSTANQETLLTELYPSADNMAEYAKLFAEDKQLIAKFKSTFSKLVKNNTNVMVEFAKMSDAPKDAQKLFGEIVNQYILGLMSDLSTSEFAKSVERLCELAADDKLGLERLKELKLNCYDKMSAAILYRHANTVEVSDIEKLIALPFFAESKDDFERVKTIKTADAVPTAWKSAATDEVQLAIDQKKSFDFLFSMYKLWLDNSEEKKDVADFVKNAKIKDYAQQTAILNETWSRHNNMAEAVNEYVDALIDAFGWGNGVKAKFMDECTDADLKAIVSGKLSWWKKLMQKFGKKKKNEAEAAETPDADSNEEKKDK